MGYFPNMAIYGIDQWMKQLEKMYKFFPSVKGKKTREGHKLKFHATEQVTIQYSVIIKILDLGVFMFENAKKHYRVLSHVVSVYIFKDW